jgi:hypothetical protein
MDTIKARVMILNIILASLDFLILQIRLKTEAWAQADQLKAVSFLMEHLL